MPGYYDLANMNMPATGEVIQGVRDNRRAKGQPQRGKAKSPKYKVEIGEPQIHPGQSNMTIPPMTMQVGGDEQDPRAAMVRQLMAQGLSYRDAMARVVRGG